MELRVFNWPILVLGDWKDISIANVIIIIKSEVSTFPIVIIFFRGCMPEMLHHILSLIAYTFRENREFVFIVIVAVYDECEYLDTFWLIIIIVQICYEGIELIKRLSDIFVECVSKIKHILSVIYYTICGAVCFQFTHFSCVDWGNIYIYICFVLLSSSNRKYELLPIV